MANLLHAAQTPGWWFSNVLIPLIVGIIGGIITYYVIKTSKKVKKHIDIHDTKAKIQREEIANVIVDDNVAKIVLWLRKISHQIIGFSLLILAALLYLFLTIYYSVVGSASSLVVEICLFVLIVILLGSGVLELTRSRIISKIFGKTARQKRRPK